MHNEAAFRENSVSEDSSLTSSEVMEVPLPMGPVNERKE